MSLKSILTRPLLSRHRVYLLVVVHLLVFTFSYRVAYALRFDFTIPPDEFQLFWRSLAWVLAVKLGIYYVSGNFHGWLRYVVFSDLVGLLWAATLSVLSIAAIDHFLIWSYQIPRAILVLDWGMSVLLTGGMRSAWRFSREQFWPMLRRSDLRRAIIIGAGPSGVGLVSQIQASPKLGYRIVAFLDPDSSKIGSRLAGIPVLGVPDDAIAVAAAQGADEILVIAGKLPGKRLRVLVEQCRAAGLQLKVVPAVGDLLDGSHSLHVRDVDINDLLRRDPVQLDCGAVESLVRGRTVLVTGAGGSIGAEICRQVLRFAPRELVLVERGENNLFTIDRALRALGTATLLRPCIADILDRRRLEQVFRAYQPEVVFHAAAHKHVPMMEENPGEAIKNNVFGTKRVADLADRYGAGSFVLISTDKAVNPSSVMGASKQLAERYVHAFSQVSATRFVVVRFGNVLGSAGSVIPIFQDQIRCGGPITVTHRDMQRFFMTIPEASQLVLQAAAMGRGGEIFVLEMGEPVRILDVAQDLIRLSGLSPDDIEIVFTGLRPGEKLLEELYLEDEQTLPTPHPKLRAAYHRPYSMAEVRSQIVALWPLVHKPEPVLRGRLREIVPEFSAPAQAAAPLRDAAEPAIPAEPGHRSPAGMNML